MRRRLVLKRRPDAALTPDEIAALPGVAVIDTAGGAGLLVEVDAEVLDVHRESLRGWVVAPEAEYPLPGAPPSPSPPKPGEGP